MCRLRVTCRRRSSTSSPCWRGPWASRTSRAGPSCGRVIMPTRWSMREPIVVPDLGLSSVVLSVWYVKPGEAVFAGDRLVELLLGNATFDIVATHAGTLAEQRAWPDDRLTTGQ